MGYELCENTCTRSLVEACHSLNANTMERFKAMNMINVHMCGISVELDINREYDLLIDQNH